MAKIKFNLLACCSIGLASFFLTFFGACQLKNKSNLVDNNNKKELYATNFSIQEYTDYQLVTIYKTWAGAANEIKYALYPREKPMPNLPADVVAIAVPVQKIVCTSSVQVAMLDFLGETDKIIGLADGKYIYNPLIFNKLENKQIADLGNDNSFNYEKLLALQPEITLVFGLNGDSKIAKKLSELGQKVIYIAEFLETEPLGRAEWVKVVAALLGKSTKEKADVLFKDSVEIPYLKIKNQLTNNQKKPTILTGLAYEGIWYVAGGKSFLATLIADAGGDYLYKNDQNTGSQSLAFEKVYLEAQKVDIWLNVSEAKNLSELQKVNILYGDFTAFRNKKVYSYSKRVSKNGGFDIFESAILRPHLVLSDFYQIIHNQPVDNLYYYQKLE